MSEILTRIFFRSCEVNVKQKHHNGVSVGIFEIAAETDFQWKEGRREGRQAAMVMTMKTREIMSEEKRISRS